MTKLKIARFVDAMLGIDFYDSHTKNVRDRLLPFYVFKKLRKK